MLRYNYIQLHHIMVIYMVTL